MVGLLAGALAYEAWGRRVGCPAFQRAGRSSMRRAKSDGIDFELLLRTLLAWLRGEPRVCSMVPVPDEADEDARRCVRERTELISERVGLTNRIGAVRVTSLHHPNSRARGRRIPVHPGSELAKKKSRAASSAQHRGRPAAAELGGRIQQHPGSADCMTARVDSLDHPLARARGAALLAARDFFFANSLAGWRRIEVDPRSTSRSPDRRRARGSDSTAPRFDNCMTAAFTTRSLRAREARRHDSGRAAGAGAARRRRNWPRQPH